MNVILIESREIGPDHTVVLADHRARHIRKILRAAPGDTVRVGVTGGQLGQATLLGVERNWVTMTVALTAPPPAKLPVDLILALPRPIMLRRILGQAASLGVERIFLINASRVEKSFFAASALAGDKLDEALRLGLEQAVDTRPPELSVHHRFRPFVEDLLPEIAAAAPIRLVAHPDTPITLPEAVPRPFTDRLLLAIGPEGGWVEFEIDQFRAQGLLPFTMGPRILRMDTAVPALIAQIDLLRQLPA